jgi:hypothetical protein
VLAAEKDPVSTAVFSPMRWPPPRLTGHRFAELGLEPKAVAALRAGAARWRAQLPDAAGMSRPDAVRSFGAPPLPGPEAPGSPSPLRPSERQRQPPFNARRNGPSPSL